MATFGRDEQLAALRRDGAALAGAAEAAGLGAGVSACPGWTVADLVWHTGEVQVFWRSVVAGGWDDPSPYEEPDRPRGDELVPWYRDGVERLVEVLGEADPDAPAWSWAPGGGTVGWIVRRMAQETAVHRWDLDGVPLNPVLAIDGVDELFEHCSDDLADGATPVGGTVHLHCTDADGEWLVAEPEPGGPLVVTREHAKGDAAVRATASDLLLLLWRRVPLDDPERFEVFGDADVARRLIARPALT